MDFYGKGVHSKDDVEVYLMSWLKWVPEDEQPELPGGWRQIMGFRRGFGIHELWRHAEHGYAFHVDEFKQWDPREGGPNMGRWPTLHATLNGVAEKYRQLWHIPSS